MTTQAISPYVVGIPDADLDDLRERLRRTRWPQPLPDAGWERSVPVDYLKQLAGYWLEQFNWREQERQLNAIPQFTTTIDNQPIDFLHVRSPEPGALPLILPWVAIVPGRVPAGDRAAHRPRRPRRRPC